MASAGSKNSRSHHACEIVSDEAPADLQVTRTKKGYVVPWTPRAGEFPIGSFLKDYVTKEIVNNIGLPSQEELDRVLPVKAVDFDLLAKPVPKEEGVRATWMGHASVLIQIDGMSILTDPMYSSRAGPMNIFGPKRFRPAPLNQTNINKLTLDVVVVSHDHYDHCDLPTLKMLQCAFPDLHWFVPAGMGPLLIDCGVPVDQFHELNWWQSAVYRDVKFVLTPAQHWCKRSLFDTNDRLWGSWTMVGPTKRAFFAGDTGYMQHLFEAIGSKYGPFDFAAIPIGAYEPRLYMQAQHINVQEAVQVHVDIKSKFSLGIHWGTFPLTFEPYMEPPALLKTVLSEQGLDPNSFVSCFSGESVSPAKATAASSAVTTTAADNASDAAAAAAASASDSAAATPGKPPRLSTI